MQATDRRQNLRMHIGQCKCIEPASVFDVISARVADLVGFEVGMLAGSIASAVVLGAPDLAVITLTEVADLARRITKASNLSLIVDADHGYGNALNVIRAIGELEAAGVSAITIEDTDLPSPFGRLQDIQVISISEMTAKLRAALMAREDPSLMVVGRTSSLSVNGIEETIARVRAYTEVGVDAIFITNVKSRQQLKAIHAATPLPLFLGSMPHNLEDNGFLASTGVRIAVKGHLPFQEAVEGIYRALKSQIDGKKLEKVPGKSIPAQLLARILHHDTHSRWQKEYLKGI